MELESEVNMWLHVSVMAPGFISNVVLFFIQMVLKVRVVQGNWK